MQFLWTMNSQRGHLIIVGRFDNLLYFQCFWFYFILILLGNVLVDDIFIIYPFFIFLLNLNKSFAILFHHFLFTCNHMHSYAFLALFYLITNSFVFYSNKFFCILDLFKPFHLPTISFAFFKFFCILFNLIFHTNAFICIHSKRVLFY